MYIVYTAEKAYIRFVHVVVPRPLVEVFIHVAIVAPQHTAQLSVGEVKGVHQSHRVRAEFSVQRILTFTETVQLGRGQVSRLEGRGMDYVSWLGVCNL